MKLIKTFEGFLNFEEPRELESNDRPRIEDTHQEDTVNYMFIGNLQTIKRLVDIMLEMDPAKVDHILRDGHNWAVDHVATSKDDIEEVANFLINEMDGHRAPNENKSYSCKECNSTYVEEDLNDDMTCESCGSLLEETAN
jgi:hypothetical protein